MMKYLTTLLFVLTLASRASGGICAPPDNCGETASEGVAYLTTHSELETCLANASGDYEVLCEMGPVEISTAGTAVYTLTLPAGSAGKPAGRIELLCHSTRWIKTDDSAAPIATFLLVGAGHDYELHIEGCNFEGHNAAVSGTGEIGVRVNFYGTPGPGGRILFEDNHIGQSVQSTGGNWSIDGPAIEMGTSSANYPNAKLILVRNHIETKDGPAIQFRSALGTNELESVANWYLAGVASAGSNYPCINFDETGTGNPSAMRLISSGDYFSCNGGIFVDSENGGTDVRAIFTGSSIVAKANDFDAMTTWKGGGSLIGDLTSQADGGYPMPLAYIVSGGTGPAVVDVNVAHRGGGADTNAGPLFEADAGASTADLRVLHIRWDDGDETQVGVTGLFDANYQALIESEAEANGEAVFEGTQVYVYDGAVSSPGAEGGPPHYIVGELPTCADAGANEGLSVLVTDGNSGTDCTTGSSSDDHICQCNDGTWAVP